MFFAASFDFPLSRAVYEGSVIFGTFESIPLMIENRFILNFSGNWTYVLTASNTITK